MSINLADLSLGNGGNSRDSLPYPMITYGASTTSSTLTPTDNVRSQGGETYGNNFGNTPFYPTSNSSPPGTWLANLKLAVLSHKHADGSLCHNVLEHAAMADSEEDPSFKTASDKLIEHLVGPVQEQVQHLENELKARKEKYDTVLANYEKTYVMYQELRNSGHASPSHSGTAGNKRKSDAPDNSGRRPPPAMHSTRKQRVEPASAPSYSTMGSHPFPSVKDTLVLLQYSSFRPGYTLPDCPLWTEQGWLYISEEIDTHASNRTTPVVISFQGTPMGSQTIPVSDSALELMVTEANISGNLRSLCRIRDSIGLALVLSDLCHEFGKKLINLPSTISSLVRRDASPRWSQFTRFFTIENVSNPNDSVDYWNNSKSKIPSVRTPNSSHIATDQEYALFIYLHYDNNGHMGVLLTDSGVFHLDTVKAHRILSAMIPHNRTHVYTFRLEFVRLVCWLGLYGHILRINDIEVDSTGHIRKCPEDLSHDIVGIARHFAACGLTPDIVNRMFHWGMQYCIDFQLSPSNSYQRKNDFAGIYKFARIRSLFYPIELASEDKIYSLPLYVDRSEVLEYRRRQFVRSYWKENQRLPDPEYRVPTIRVSTNPATSNPVPIDQLTLANIGNDVSSPSHGAGATDGSAQATQGSHNNLSASNYGASDGSAQATQSSLVVSDAGTIDESAGVATQGSKFDSPNSPPQLLDRDVTMNGTDEDTPLLDAMEG